MKDELETLLQELEASGWRNRFNPSGIFTVPRDTKYLDTADLARLEETFRKWADKPKREDVRVSRKRILAVFLLIRHTGARLGEVLALDDRYDVDLDNLRVRMGNNGTEDRAAAREVPIPPELGRELREMLDGPEYDPLRGVLFHMDPGYVRRKFYERAEAGGLPRDMGTPSALRRSRAIELLRSNLPLPVVQKILGHSTASLTASYLDFSEPDMQRVVRRVIDKESRKTSARNVFFGRVSNVKRGDIQSVVELTTLTDLRIFSIITNESLERLQLDVNRFATAEVKAPWVIVSRDEHEPKVSAGNLFRGEVVRVIRGAVTTEFVVRLPDGTELCSLVTEESRRRLEVKETDVVWAMFNAFAVILNVD